jgi:hypothetical protein
MQLSPFVLPAVGHQPFDAHAIELASLRRDIGMHLGV